MFKWDQRADDLVKRLHQDGVLVPDIAKLMGLTLYAVQHRKVTLSLCAGKAVSWSEEEDEVLRVLADDFDNAEIGALLGRSGRAVERRLPRIRFQRPPAWYLARGLKFFSYPPDLREVMLLNRKLGRRLRDEEHRRSA